MNNLRWSKCRTFTYFMCLCILIILTVVNMFFLSSWCSDLSPWSKVIQQNTGKDFAKQSPHQTLHTDTEPKQSTKPVITEYPTAMPGSQGQGSNVTKKEESLLKNRNSTETSSERFQDNTNILTNKPVTHLQKNATQPPKPVSELPKPVTQPPKPVTQSPKPVTQPPTQPFKPATSPPKPVTQPPKPVTKPPKTPTQPPKPVIQPPKPITQPPKPVTQSPKQVTRPLIQSLNNESNVTDILKEESLLHNSNPVSTKWLFNNSNILTNESISDDLMPNYFNFSADLVPQFERYFNETKLIMKSRVENFRKLCIEKLDLVHRTIHRRMFYFPELNMAWCPAFKAGSTNWKQFFCKIYNAEVYNEYLEKVDEDPYCPLDVLLEFKNLTTFSPLQLKNWTGGVNRAVKFLTVRHPYERLISVYANKLKNCEDPMFIDNRMLKILETYRNVSFLPPDVNRTELIESARLECHKPLNDRAIDTNNPYMNPMGVTFKEFISYIVRDDTRIDYHWAPISGVCGLCVQDYDVIEKAETFERDHYFLLKMAGQESRYPDIAGSHSNPSGKSVNSTIDKITEYFAALNETLLWKLQHQYHHDFDLFEYKPYFRVLSNDSLTQPIKKTRNHDKENNEPETTKEDSPILSNDSPLLSNDSPILSNDSPLLSNESPILSNDSPLF